ncbi:hypothetical protein LMG28688_05819 [Paraburkholderia caffeinitolerans]|uniref:Uncharacterized protein n=1 Tax=Paraburkholderia caffeinitolerans TaxID=1723730 RepID=A0A6J5GMH3_9BURK|nr:hypothetical protein LMG28688_05819 [Paraburkholderia caffeinitolerans]
MQLQTTDASDRTLFSDSIRERIDRVGGLYSTITNS